MKDEILSVLQYFSFFQYPPTATELFFFLPKQTTINQLNTELEAMVKEGVVIKNEMNARYAEKGKRSHFSDLKKRKDISLDKLQKAQGYLNIISRLPYMRYVGISGSLAMNNGKEESDVDLCIVTAEGHLWTVRFCLIMIAQLFGLRNSMSSSRVCLNLFFDESDLTIRREKRNLYVAHELLQLKTIHNRNNTYGKILDSNKWAGSFFPNVKIPKVTVNKHKKGLIHKISDIVEYLLKIIQLKIINKRLSEEYITETQLWLIQNDFENNMKEILDKNQSKNLQK